MVELFAELVIVNCINQQGSNMADYIIFDGNGTITKKYISVDGADIKDRPDCLKVDRVVITSLTKFHKVENGEVVEMTQVEKDNLLQAEADAQIQTENEAIENFEIKLKVVLTALIKRINVRIPNNPITKKEVVDQLRQDLLTR